ncbi:unnamed protein product [Brachionus calyciflorus]|uniref:E3 SUMO-protein ligase NSE2 n=1 Tax=Brachionus calyciflorus TaxID=104777 RepID=A0A813M357_9BILA|nr:unnamed protein product [Brachionus calyciflorus]
MTQISYQMNEFQSSMQSIEQKFDLIHRTVKETLSDLNLGFEYLKQSMVNNKEETPDEIGDFKQKIIEEVLKECETMNRTLKDLVEITNNCKDFQEKEISIRRKLTDDPENFDEKNLKELIQAKATQRNIDDPRYLEIVELLENAKNGDFSSGDDIVMDAPTTQIVKCPITGKAIENGVKNTLCDHMYEKSAILHYIKTVKHKRCPYAGCTQKVAL